MKTISELIKQDCENISTSKLKEAIKELKESFNKNPKENKSHYLYTMFLEDIIKQREDKLTNTN